MQPKGLFITFEGIDGAGKSSHIEALAHAFRAQGRAVLTTREPGGTPLSEALRSLILNETMDALTEALLVFAARREHIVQVIAPALQDGQVVLCDRFTDATFAYQGGGRGYPLDTLLQLEHLVQYGQGIEPDFLLHPDVTLWFRLPPCVAAARLAASRAPDKFESMDEAFFDRVHQGYQQRADQFPARFATIDAHLGKDQVWSQVQAVLVSRGLLR